MNIKEFDYNLPKELIAQFPASQRDESRLLIVDRKKHDISHARFRDILDLIAPEDALVINDTKVRPVRLIGSVGKTEVDILLVERLGKNIYTIKAKPGKKVKAGCRISFGQGRYRAVCRPAQDEYGGAKIIEFEAVEDVEDVLEQIGSMPLPPYIKRLSGEDDVCRYQTVYAASPGAIAAPTAGLHFTRELLADIKKKQAEVIKVTLHTGLGTFTPVRTDDIRQHRMHEELFSVSAEAGQAIERIKNSGKRVWAVGTTSCRVLESSACIEKGCLRIKPGNGRTGIFIYPGYEFKAVDVLVTNFHLPKTTLLMLVYAFAGKELSRRAYDEAIKEKYRFYSYGDCMVII